MNVSKSLFILILLSFALIADAQTDNLSVSSTIGISAPLLDSGKGFHLGINPSYSILSKVSIEGQLSYLYTKVGSSFLSGKTGNSNSINILLGGRSYLNRQESTYRWYVNFLLGGNYSKENENGVKYDEEFNLGISIGAYLERNKFLIGLSIESPQNLVLKIGYTLKK